MMLHLFFFFFFLVSSSRNQSFQLQVLERKRLGCFQPEDRVKYLLVDKGGTVPCPGLNCSDNTDVIWYKMKRKVVRERAGPLSEGTGQTEAACLPPFQSVQAVSEQRRDTCERAGLLDICWVRTLDTGVYFCDRQTADNWIFRRAVNVTVVRKCNWGYKMVYQLCWPPSVGRIQFKTL